MRYLALVSMLLNELQKQDRRLEKVSARMVQEQASNAMLRGEVPRQTEAITQLTERSEQQTAQNPRLSAEVAQLKGMFERAMAAQRASRSLAAAFNR